MKKRRDVARFVCKQWYSVCKGLNPVSFTWPLGLPDEENQTAKGLVRLAHSLTIQASRSGLTFHRIASWTAMMGTLSSLTHEHGLPKLRSLHLMSGVFENLTVQLSELPRLSFLTTLRIEKYVRLDLLHLFSVLKSCPNLEELIIKPPYKSDLHDGWSPVMTTSQEDDLVHGDPLPTTRLRTCILYTMVITLPALRAFLGASPELSKLILIRSFYFARGGNHAVQVQDRLPVIDLVASHCPNLKAFHLSPFNRTLSDQEVTSILERFPSMEEYSFSEWDNGPALLTGLRTIVNRVTTLNLVAFGPSHQPLGQISLREILCTFEHLVHLRAPNMKYPLEEFNVNDRSAPLITTNVSRKRYIWACRGLRTLHMAIECRNSDSVSPYEALIIFGFLSRMCPRLQELHLKRSYLDLSFPGGFCLLTRLQELERLKITTVYDHHLDKHALDWIRPQPSIMDRLKYNQLLSKTEKELQVYHRSLPRTDTAAATAARAKRIKETAELGVDIGLVGYVEDLLEWMDDRYEGRPPMWPKLESFWIESLEWMKNKPLKKLEAFVRKARPNVDVQLRYPSGNAFLATLDLY
ncbi:hypothetical protein BGX33_010163 [Mortierella sp. NVP41]|nr:hypothetical protein BGX33_010163 [Mortierella sp. NVP41]